MNRRKFMITVGVGTTVAVAGCSDGGTDTDPNSGDSTGADADTSSPIAAVESFYQLSYNIEQDASVEELIDAVDPLVHSVPPIPDLIRGAEDSDNESVSRSIETINTEVDKQNLDKATLNQQFGLTVHIISRRTRWQPSRKKTQS
jgi:hypothetical protein